MPAVPKKQCAAKAVKKGNHVKKHQPQMPASSCFASTTFETHCDTSTGLHYETQITQMEDDLQGVPTSSQDENNPFKTTQDSHATASLSSLPTATQPADTNDAKAVPSTQSSSSTSLHPASQSVDIEQGEHDLLEGQVFPQEKRARGRPKKNGAKEKPFVVEAIAEDVRMVYPWGVWNQDEPFGPPPMAGGHYYAQYMITWSKPTQKLKNQNPSIKDPEDHTTQEFLDSILEAHHCCGTTIRVAAVRKERSNDGQVHQHAEICAGNSKKRFGWKQSYQHLADKGIMVHYNPCSLQAGVSYLYYDSSKKHHFNFIGSMLLHYADGEVRRSAEEIADGCAEGYVKEKMDFLEFRDYLEQQLVNDYIALQQATKTDKKLDEYLNNRSHEPQQQFRKAIRCLQLRNFQHTRLIDFVCQQYTNLDCCCDGRFLESYAEISKHAELPEEYSQYTGDPHAISIILLVWMALGRVRGNTLAICGESGTGKSWILNTLKELLDNEYYEIPTPVGTYPLARLGYYFPLTRCFLLDELSLRMLRGMLGSEGFWKRWLTLQTSRTIRPAFPKNAIPDRESFKDAAPIMYTATNPVRLEIDQDGYKTSKSVRIENEQASQRDKIVQLTKVVYNRKTKPIPSCPYCLSKTLCLTRQRWDLSFPIDLEDDTP
ncbi:unnamed protein product [Amoebophrya sp. A25]|nr:unnamed protein product [Amoebophrya sp. A25]|eukprot:GSA25T00020026001.1